MITDALRSIIDLLKLKKDAKKVDLEIQKLSRENKEADSLLRIATMEEIEKFGHSTVNDKRKATHSLSDFEDCNQVFGPGATVFFIRGVVILALIVVVAIFAIWKWFR